MRSSASVRIACVPLALLSSLLLVPRAAAQITAGNLVVVRVGDGAAALSSAAAAVFLDEYTASGTFVQSIALPTGASDALTNAGSSTSEGFLNLSTDGQYLVHGGYRAIPGTAGVAASAASRVIGRVALNGSIDTTTALTDAYLASNLRSVASTDGTQFWTAGTAATGGGVRYVASLGATTSTSISTTVTNTRVIGIAGGQLYVTSASGTFQGLCSVGTGLPTTTGQTTAVLPGFPITGTTSNYDYYFHDAATVYVADDRAIASGGGIQKWTWSGSAWSLAYTLNSGLTAGVRGLTANNNSSPLQLFATSADAPTRLVTVTDSGAASAFSTLASAATNTAFRGVRLVPTGCVSPTIPTGGQPVNATACAGGPASFSVSANGTGPLAYQWRKETNPISGATSATYLIASAATADAGNYDVVVTNACGSVTSATASLTVNEAPSISGHPGSATACAGSPASFAVTATGTGPLSYQWRRNGADIGGATGTTYAIAAATVADAGSYDVVVSNVCGTTTSNAATLTVDVAPTIKTHPSALTVCATSPASFAVSANGTAPLSYQWRRNGTDIGGATSATYAIASATLADAGSYDVVVTNACGSATSNAATLTVDVPPAITAQPTSLTACTGSSAGFSVTATGTAPLSYQWRRNGLDIGGATAATFTIAAVAAADAGNYDVVVTNPCGSLPSQVATLTVNLAPVITTQPTSIAVCSGSPVALNVVATGTANTYQWHRNLVPIPGATSASYSIAAAQLTDAGTYTVTVTNSCGTQTSAGAVVAVDTSIKIATTCVSTDAGPQRAIARDLDGVRGGDLIVSAYSAGTVQVFLNDGPGTFTPQLPVLVGSGASGLCAADFDGDGRIDIAVANRLGASVTVLYGDGAGAFSATFTIATGGEPTAVAALPLAGNASADLAIADATGRLLVAINGANSTPGARTFAAPTSILTGGPITDVGAADVVGTTAAEIVATDATASVVHVIDALTLTGVAGSPFACTTTPSALALLDVTGDGKADPIVGGAGGVGVLETPALAANSVWASPAISVTAGNVDADVKGDIAFVAASGQLLVLHGYNTGAAPDRVEAGSCLLSGSHVAAGRVSRIGAIGSPALDTDELVLVRSAADTACVLRFRIEQGARGIAGTGCTGHPDTGSTIGLPTIGNAMFIYALDRARAGSFTVLFTQANAPSGSPPPLFPIGPCTHVLDLTLPYLVSSTLTSPLGQAFLITPIPNATPFVGLELRSQWFTVDPTGPVFGMTFSTATLIRIGEY